MSVVSDPPGGSGPGAAVIDVHVHLAPVDVSNEPASAAPGPPALYDAARLEAWLAEHRIDQGWVSAPPPFYRAPRAAKTAVGPTADEVTAWALALDTGMAARIADSPRLRLLTYLPLDYPEAALRLLDSPATDRVVHAGWCAAAGGGSLALDDPRLATVWERVAASGRPLLLHPGESPDPRLRRHYLTNLLGNPHETALAVAELVFGGVLTRHPELRLVLAHCGGTVAAVVGRWTRGVVTARPGVSPDLEEPTAAVRRLWVDSLGHSPGLLRLATETFGPEHVVLGSDYPFPMGADSPWDSLAWLPSDQQLAIARNAAALIRNETP